MKGPGNAEPVTSFWDVDAGSGSSAANERFNREKFRPHNRVLSLWITRRQVTEKSGMTAATIIVHFLIERTHWVSTPSGFIAGNRQADIDPRSPDNLRHHENPQRNIEQQQREQAECYNPNHATAILSAYGFTAVHGNAGEPENVSEAW